MLRQLFSKWFGVDLGCATCEVLRAQLDESNRERRELLSKLLTKDSPEPLSIPQEEIKPLQPQFVPWRVRQQILETEDRKQAELLKKNAENIQKLEKEMGVNNAS